MPEQTPIVERLRHVVERELAWLEDDGYAQVDATELRSSVRLSYASERGRISVTADAGRGEVEIWLAPPDPGDPRAEIDFLRERPRVMLQALIAAHELRVPSGRWDKSEHADAVVAAYVGALRELRDRELAGDWSGLDDAKSRARAAMNDEIERIRDPQLRDLMRRYRSRS
ncbi:MAG: hypothetical protein V7607_693 [Solirubrobacteraceae bacterium]